METGKLIKELRLQKGLTQEELAVRTEVSARTIQRIENGDVDPRAYTLQMIAKALDVDYSLFIDKPNQNQDTQETNERNWSALLHLGGILPLIFPTLLIRARIKNKTTESTKHFFASISMQLCVLGVCLIGLWIYWRVDQLVPFAGGLLVGALVAIVNTISVINGRTIINPFIKSIEKFVNK